MPRSEVGSYALDLADLAARKIPLPTSYCLPVSTLKKVAEHNQLADKFESLTRQLNSHDNLQLNQTLNKAQSLVLNQQFPSHISRKLLDFYHQKLDRDFVRLTASPVSGSDTEYKREENIVGDANMLQSILRLWSANITPRHLLQQQLFPVAIAIQSQTQPIASGLAFTQDPNSGDKTQLVVRANWGVFADSTADWDWYSLDQRSWEVTEHQIARKTTKLTRNLDELKSTPVEPDKQTQPCLNQDQLQELGEIIRTIKLNRISQLKVHWSLTDQGFWITKIKPFYFSPKNKNGTYQTAAIGQSVTTGYISGQAQPVTSQQDLDRFQPGSIAVVGKLTTDYYRLIQTASAIVCQQGIEDPELLSKIKHYQLPVIAHADHVLSTLKSGREVVVDAGAGKVYYPQSKKQTRIKPAKTKLYLAVNQPSEVSSKLTEFTSGIGLLRSEHLFVKQGAHPISLIRARPQKLKEQFSREIISFYHRFTNLRQQAPQIVFRSMNLTSSQLKQFSGRQGLEADEPNPYLGYRGGLRALNEPEIFNFELELIEKVNRRLDKQMVMLVPFVRTSFELMQLLAHIRHKIEQEVLRPQVWLQINTPENVLNLDQYLQTDIHGLSVNVKSLHALLHGIDPDNPDIFNLYQPDDELTIDLLSQIKAALDEQPKQIKTLVNLFDFDLELIRFVVNHNYDGITVRPQLAQQFNQAAAAIEEHRL